MIVFSKRLVFCMKAVLMSYLTARFAILLLMIAKVPRFLSDADKLGHFFGLVVAQSILAGLYALIFALAAYRMRLSNQFQWLAGCLALPALLYTFSFTMQAMSDDPEIADGVWESLIYLIAIAAYLIGAYKPLKLQKEIVEVEEICALGGKNAG